ncbi:MAG: selenide, water dikinase SelD [Acidaminococcaceae bacterium]|nr:selenide, water dikinase SelD [Acidaminococcaceae bacterium]
MPKATDTNLLVGFDSNDDAAVYKINEDTAMIQTVDFFPPMVDDPYSFGQIAAANALSDVYAMGGKPVLAMNLLTFPNCLPLSVVEGILQGGASKVLEAGAVIAGGHSIEDKEPKYGLCVTGLVNPRKVLTNNGIKEGDILIITKALGTGILTTAAKAELLTPEENKTAITLMATLNKAAA